MPNRTLIMPQKLHILCMTKWYFLKYDVPPKQTNQAVAVLTRRLHIQLFLGGTQWRDKASCMLSALFNGYIVEQSSLLIDKLTTWLMFSRHNLKCGAGGWQALSLCYFESFFTSIFPWIPNQLLCPIRQITVCKLFWILCKTRETIE